MDLAASYSSPRAAKLRELEPQLVGKGRSGRGVGLLGLFRENRIHRKTWTGPSKVPENGTSELLEQVLGTCTHFSKVQTGGLHGCLKLTERSLGGTRVFTGRPLGPRRPRYGEDGHLVRSVRTLRSSRCPLLLVASCS